MKKVLVLAVLCMGFGEPGGCDEPPAARGKATNCTVINTPVGCPQVYRITDPDTGAVLYVCPTGAVTLLPKGEVQAEKPAAK